MVRKQKQHVREIWEKTGKKIQWKEDSVGGGGDVVREMLMPTLNSLNMASRKYKQALAAEGSDTY
jgi:transcription initiation factor TFIIH subunit 1